MISNRRFSLDLIILEGYVFENAAAILPHLEHPRTGVTSHFCSEIAKKLQCYVFAGYPEALKPGESDTKGVSDDMPNGNQFEGVGANSAVLYGPEGEWIGGYRKTNLFETDKTWAKAGKLHILLRVKLSLTKLSSLNVKGTGFAVFNLPPPLRTVCLGICMDLNPQIQDWQREDGPYELASHCLSNKANLLILLNAWLDSNEEPEEEHDWHTLNYWAGRLRPLWTDENSEVAAAEPSSTKKDDKHSSRETVVVICNRNGEENG